MHTCTHKRKTACHDIICLRGLFFWLHWGNAYTYQCVIWTCCKACQRRHKDCVCACARLANVVDGGMHALRFLKLILCEGEPSLRGKVIPYSFLFLRRAYAWASIFSVSITDWRRWRGGVRCHLVWIRKTIEESTDLLVCTAGGEIDPYKETCFSIILCEAAQLIKTWMKSQYGLQFLNRRKVQLSEYFMCIKEKSDVKRFFF